MIRLLIADDHPVVRQGLRRIVEAHADMRVLGEVADGDAMLEAVRREQPDVLLMDVGMPGPGFLALLAMLREEAPRVRVLVLSVQPEAVYGVRALRAGAAGYLSKEHSPEELAAAIRRVHGGGRYVSTALAEKLALDLGPDAEAAPHTLLSEREYQVLCLLAAGRAGKEIAAELELSPRTVSTYRTRILEKLQLKTNADLIRYALEHKLTP